MSLLTIVSDDIQMFVDHVCRYSQDADIQCCRLRDCRYSEKLITAIDDILQVWRQVNVAVSFKDINSKR